MTWLNKIEIKWSQIWTDYLRKVFQYLYYLVMLNTASSSLINSETQTYKLPWFLNQIHSWLMSWISRHNQTKKLHRNNHDLTNMNEVFQKLCFWGYLSTFYILDTFIHFADITTIIHTFLYLNKVLERNFINYSN